MSYFPNASTAAGVGSFNTRTGSVSLLSSDVTGALSFTPYNASNPAAYQTAGQVSSAIQTVVGAAPAALATLAAIDTQLAGDESAAGALTTIVSGHATAIAANSAAIAAKATQAFVRSVYTASGAIAATDTLSILNGTTALAMTLGNGTVDGQGVLIKLLGSANATVTANIDWSSGNSVTLTASAAGTLRDSLKLKWSVADTTWIAE